MFEKELNSDCEHLIWKIYFKHVLDELVRDYKHIWSNNSKQLHDLTMDNGCYQGLYQSGLDDMVEDHYLIDNSRINCGYCKVMNIFPCNTCRMCLFDDEINGYFINNAS